MLKYFKGCQTIEDVKQRYRELAKKIHPDCGGNAEDFKRMSAEYTEAFERYKNIHVNAAGETYEKETSETPVSQTSLTRSSAWMECTLRL